MVVPGHVAEGPSLVPTSMKRDLLLGETRAIRSPYRRTPYTRISIFFYRLSGRFDSNERITR